MTLVSNTTPCGTSTGRPAGVGGFEAWGEDLPPDVVAELVRDAANGLTDRCAMRLGTDFSSFLLIGRGGVEDSPDEPQSESPERLRQKAKTKVRSR